MLNYEVSRMYHPSLMVPDLDEAQRFFKEVFGREPTANPFSVVSVVPEDYPVDYCILVPVAEVLIDCIDPGRYQIPGAPPRQPVERPFLSGIGWGIQGFRMFYNELRRRQIGCTDQRNLPAEGAEPPKGSRGRYPVVFTLGRDSGLKFGFHPTEWISSVDPRSDPTWELPLVSDDDPLRIVCCAYHTILTTDPKRSIGFGVDVLGGEVIYQGRNHRLPADSTYVAVGDAIIEYAVPLDPNSSAMGAALLTVPEDAYYSLTWLVEDLDCVARHLRACGVGVLDQDSIHLTADPEHALGVPWGFTTERVPNDAVDRAHV